MKKFKAKFNKGIVIAIMVGFIAIFSDLIIQKSSFLSLSLMIISLFFILSIFLLTHYDITPDNKLIIKLGFINYAKIDIESIKNIKKTNSIISAPAPSLDRIEIFYNKFDSIIISPKDKIGFMKELKNINHNIVF